jgi:5-oxoprolinase (ATP-hydrolysing) subunit A
MRATVRLAKAHGVKVGAHPSLPDLQGFGRREMKIGREELSQLPDLPDRRAEGLSRRRGHGAQSHQAAWRPLRHGRPRQEAVAHAVCDAADVFGVPLMGLAGTLHETIYTERGHVFWPEFFADLDYSDDGRLIITREHDAKDPATVPRRCALARCARGKLETQGGQTCGRGSDSVCIHSDTPNAIAIAEAVREALRPHLDA